MDAYRVVKKIGVGTYGSACLACLKQDPTQLFVLKKVKVDEDNDKERDQAEMEVSVLSNLNHPLVLGYVDHFMYKGHLCIITEYCEEGDLYGRLRSLKAAPPEPQVLDWLVQITLAVQYVHSNGILHRDLKTQNIFLTHDGLIRLGDFGISRPLKGAMDLASTLIGTPYYMSPEVMSSQPYDFKSDMWSLGCCLYEMMSLKHAFDATDMNSLVLKIMRGQHLPISQQYSPELRDLTKSLLSKNPKLRPSADAVLKLPWLKDYVARANERVRALREFRSKSPYRRRTSQGAGGPDGALDTLDRELEAAKQKLQRIQAERDALQVAAMRGAGGGAVKGGGRASHVGSSTGLLPNSGPDPLLYPPAGHKDGVPGGGGAQARKEAPLARESPPLLKMQQQMQQLQLQQQAQAQQQAQQALVHKEQQQQQQQQLQGGLDPGMLARLDPKARKELKRQQEIQQREAELLQARKAYFHVRKQAEAKKWHMIHGETVPDIGLKTGGYPTAHHHHSHSEGGLPGDDDLSRSPFSLPQAPFPAWQAGNGADAHTGAAGDNAAAEFEEELQRGGSGNLWGAGLGQKNLLNVLGSTGGVKAESQERPKPQPTPAQRAAALRELCVSALGPVLFEVLYDAMRRRLGGTADDAYFHRELQARLGPHHMQYVHLVDQLLYLEELAGLRT